MDSNGLPTPVFNFLKQIVLHQVATITSDNIKLHCSPLKAAANDKKLETLTSIVNDEFASLFEHNRVPSLMREYMRNAAVDGDGCTYTYWDTENEKISTKILDNSRVFFGNPNDRHVQTQPYILISRRIFVKEAQEYAKEHGGQADAVKADTDENNSNMDILVDGKCTVVLKMWKDKKTNTIHAAEAVKDGIVRPEWDVGIKLYPITWLNWDYVRDCYHGQAFITGLIPNQQAVNKLYAMVEISLMMSAFPRTVFDKTRVPKWTNQVGAAIGVNGSVEGIAKILEPAQISPQVGQFIDSFIQNTQSFTGATSAALGNTRPDNTSAIIALQRASAIPSEITKQNEFQSIEDLGRIYTEFMGEYYGVRQVDQPISNVMAPEALSFAGIDPDKKVQADFDFSVLKDVQMSMQLDVGASSYWSEIASMQTLDNLLQLGQIDIVDYLERIPDGYISKREELLDKYKGRQQQAQAAQMQPPQNPEQPQAP